MIRFISERRPLLLGLLLTLGACTTRLPAPVPACVAPPPPTAEVERAQLSLTASALQLNPYTDAATRADPYPCARAVSEAQQHHTPLPRCYYIPMGLQ